MSATRLVLLLSGRPQKLGGFDDAIRIPADGDDSRVDVPPRAECPRHHLAPYVGLTCISIARCDADFWKRNQGGGALRLFFGYLVSRYPDPLDARSFQGTPGRHSIFRSGPTNEDHSLGSDGKDRFGRG